MHSARHERLGNGVQWAAREMWQQCTAWEKLLYSRHGITGHPNPVIICLLFWPTDLVFAMLVCLHSRTIVYGFCVVILRTVYIRFVVMSLSKPVRVTYKSLPLSEKIADFGILLNTLSSSLKNKDKILNTGNSFGKDRKRICGPENPEVDKSVLKGIKQAQDQKIPVSGPRQPWLAGWLQNLCMVRVANEWKTDLLEMISDRLNWTVFQVYSDKTMIFKGESCSNGKLSKDRVTLLVGANMDGSEKLPLLIIGKSTNPGCFKSMKSKAVEYEANRKAWMTCELFEKWLVKLDNKMSKQKREVLLFIDKCTLQKAILARNVKVNDIRNQNQEDNGEEIMPAMEGFRDLTSSSVSYEEFVTMDDDVVVCGEQADAEIVAEVVSSRVHSSRSSDEENEPSELPVQPLPTSVETMECIHELWRYFRAQQNVIQFSNHLISLKIL
ncbi:hypothetical protein PR048_015078 [Dryococelus australis]|uniref:DDE-1 domain-containing protein n=1 Tax=Dryococelus australis TaxID=614101 RepID=A0ABQ9HGX4_9NEOP|nr:hypothetical protein PR048_015078 [Dryococelus australis]